MYSIDTGHFYSNREKYLHDTNCKYRQERNYVNNKIAFFDEVMKLYGYTNQDLNYIKDGKIEKITIVYNTSDLIYEYFYWHNIIRRKRKKAHESKQKLLKILKNKVNHNIKMNKHNKIINVRKLRENDLNDNDIISVFESSLTRAIDIEQDELTDTLLVVQVYYFDIFKDIISHGFMFKNEKYKYFTSSAGQIRKKKAVFIKESIWDEIKNTIMCGLTIDKINEKGGNNVNKHLAYLALSNSATDVWEDFDIDKSIVIDDFETDVFGTFDLIDDCDYSITRKNDFVPIPHTDGAGMMLPSVCDKNFMFRAPWIKGLLAVFDFKRFIEINNYSPIIKDIYGKEYNIIKDDIQIILTKSQFKMHKYYKNWDEYKYLYKHYNCTAGICNIEDDRIKNAKINYQMLQTLTNITDDEIISLTEKSANKIEDICKTKETMLNILGVTPYNKNMTPFQKALKIYPPLLSDTYAKDAVREVKNSLLKRYRGGKLEISGKYTFIIPDFYAACEYWFGGIEKPKGLLKDGEVFCNLYKKHDKLDCLRSPHLYREHAIRFNIASDVYKDRAESIREWFTTNALYTSSHDLISKILQFDCDGDISLVVADHDFVRIAERNMNDVVPLYYNMQNADSTLINNKTIYNGLINAFTYGNIGIYSNDISKIWNSDVFLTGTDNEKQDAIKVIKLLCMENNFCIDAAKTLYMPKRPEWFKTMVSKYTKKKLPRFFKYAKDKENGQIEKANGSFVNMIFDNVPNKHINTRGLELGSINYHLLMDNVNTVCSKEVSELYDRLNSQYRYKINMKDEYIDNLRYVACEIRKEFSETGYSQETVADMLVEYLYGHEKRYKQLLWFCYGQYIVNNLEKNVVVKKTKVIQCIDCDEWFDVDIKDGMTCRCDNCLSAYKRDRDRLRKQKYRMSHEVNSLK